MSQASIDNREDFFGVNLGRFFLGALLVIIGLAYLAEKFNLLSVDTGYFLSHFWSLLLIWLGLSFLSRRNKTFQLLGLSFAVIVLCFIISSLLGVNASSPSDRVQVVKIEKGIGVKNADVDINSGATVLHLAGMLPEANNSKDLIAGKFESEFFKLNSGSDTAGDLQVVSLATGGDSSLERWRSVARNLNNFDLKIATDTPLKLTVRTAAADINLDLKNILAQAIQVNSGASNIKILLGDRVATSTVDISAGASAITLDLPKTVGARIKINSNLSSIDLKDFVQSERNVYLSPDYDKMAKKTNISIDAGVSRIEINWH